MTLKSKSLSPLTKIYGLITNFLRPITTTVDTHMIFLFSIKQIFQTFHAKNSMRLRLYEIHFVIETELSQSSLKKGSSISSEFWSNSFNFR